MCCASVLSLAQVSGGAEAGQAVTDAIDKRLEELESELKVRVAMNGDGIHVCVRYTLTVTL